MGNISEFEHAVQLVIDNVSFEKPATVQVFEATIRFFWSSALSIVVLCTFEWQCLDSPIISTAVIMVIIIGHLYFTLLCTYSFL